MYAIRSYYDLARRIAEFDGSYVLAAAAYNAGAHRVDRWIGSANNSSIVKWLPALGVTIRSTRFHTASLVV